MPKGDRSDRSPFKPAAIIAAAIGVAIIATGVGYGLIEQSRYRYESANQRADYAKYAAEQIRQTCFRDGGIEKTHCLQKAITEYRLKTRDDQREQSDLVAQRQSALWTAIMGVASLIGMALSAVGVGLVWITFREQRRTNNITQTEADRARTEAAENAGHAKAALVIAARNARAAAKLVEVSQDTAKRQLRAYVVVANAEHDIKVGEKILVHLTVQNTGQTPAVKFTGAARVSLGPPNVAMMHTANVRDFPESEIGAGGTSTFHGTTGSEIDERVLKEIENGACSIYCDGEITYTDIFGSSHWVKFCLESDRPLKLGTFSPVGDAIRSDTGENQPKAKNTP